MNRRRFVMALFALAATAAGAIEPDQVMVSYELKLGTRQIVGVSHELEWAFRALDADHAQMRFRVPVDSFDSGHHDFDSLWRRALDSKRHPYVQIEGVAQEGRLDGNLELAGVVRPVTVRLHSERVAGNVIAVASLELDLRDYGIAFEGVDPHAAIELVARVAASPDAVLAGGLTRPSN